VFADTKPRGRSDALSTTMISRADPGNRVENRRQASFDRPLAITDRNDERTAQAESIDPVIYARPGDSPTWRAGRARVERDMLRRE
jgi:hypothetical protein